MSQIGTDCYTPDQTNAFWAENHDLINGAVADAIVRMSPYANALEGGTFATGSRDMRSVVQEGVALSGSLARPEFVDDFTACGLVGERDRFGTTEYSYRAQTYRKLMQEICVKQAKIAFKSSMKAAINAAELAVKRIINADIKYQPFFRQSGMKFIMTQPSDGYTFDQMLAGDVNAIETDFPQVLPTSPLTWKALKRLANTLFYDLGANKYTLQDAERKAPKQAFIFNGSDQQIELLRNDLDIKADLHALAAGSFQIGEKSLTGFQFEGPWRGVAFGVDDQPLRFNVFDVNGWPDLIEPEVIVNVTNGVAPRRNVDWLNAQYEIGFLIAPGSFRRLMPENWQGEGMIKFPDQFGSGKLQWHYAIDNGCNVWGDYGFLKYEIQRAIKPERPHHVIAIAYKRCTEDTGGYACTDSDSDSNSL